MAGGLGAICLWPEPRVRQAAELPTRRFVPVKAAAPDRAKPSVLQPGHMSIMTTLGFDAAQQRAWTTMAITNDLVQLHNRSLQVDFTMMYGPLPDCNGCGSGVWDRKHRGLDLNWKNVLARTLATLPAKGVAGIFVGDELMCGGIPYSDFSSVLQQIRMARPRGFLLYANECRWSCGLHDAACSVVKSWRAAGVPADLDLISFDEYTSGKFFTGQAGAKCPIYFTDPAAEVQIVRNFYQTVVYPRLHPHQRVLVVPPVYACSEFAILQQDKYAARSLQEYANWGWNDTNIAGLNSWHYNTRHKRQEGPPCPCDERIGAAQMPKSLKLLRSLGIAIKRRDPPTALNRLNTTNNEMPRPSPFAWGKNKSSSSAPPALSSRVQRFEPGGWGAFLGITRHPTNPEIW
eukprot:SAG31_NODE_62_length_28678_cov_21.548270_18_plen_403_part_00